MSDLIHRYKSSESKEKCLPPKTTVTPYIGSKEEAPSYTVDNQYLLTGYRINYDSIQLAFSSVFKKHNETCNIWTHFIPLMFVIILGIESFIYNVAPYNSYFAEDHWNQDGIIAIWPIQYQFITLIYLFGMSSIYHTFFCVNEHLSCVLLRLDYSGICLIVSGGVVPVIQYGFYCNIEIKNFYTIGILSLCLLTWLISLFEFMHEEKFVFGKLMIYGIFFIFSFIPSFHLILYQKWNLLGEHFHLHDCENYFYFILFSLVCGILIYGYRFPERHFQKRFDIFINSHSIWHIFVVMGCCGSYLFCLSMYAIREHYQCI